LSHALIIARRPVSLIRSASSTQLQIKIGNEMERERGRDDLQMAEKERARWPEAPLSTANMHAMHHIWRHGWMNSGRGRAVPIKPLNATDGRSSRPEQSIERATAPSSFRPASHTLFPIEALHCSSASHYTLNLACRFQVTVHHYNAFHYHTVHSTPSLPPFRKECNYVLRVNKNSSRLIKFLVNNIHIYGFKIIYYKNTFYNLSNDIYFMS
jgi:hypothetical protein